MNSKVLNTLLELIHEESLPLTVEVGQRHAEYDGSISIDMLYEYEFKDSDVVNEAICRAINLTFDLVDN